MKRFDPFIRNEIVDRAGAVIYEETETDVSSKVENNLVQMTTADTEAFADSDILNETHNILDDTPYSIQSVDISDAEEITGKCLNLTLTLSNVDDSSVGRISSVYDDLESYSLSTGAITQCNITLLNAEQECIDLRPEHFKNSTPTCAKRKTVKQENRSPKRR